MDKNLAAKKIRQRLEDRLARILHCESSDFNAYRLGALIHLAFLLDGVEESIGGFNVTMRTVLDLIGSNLVWKTPEAEATETEPPKTVVN